MSQYKPRNYARLLQTVLKVSVIAPVLASVVGCAAMTPNQSEAPSAFREFQNSPYAAQKSSVSPEVNALLAQGNPAALRTLLVTDACMDRGTGSLSAAGQSYAAINITKDLQAFQDYSDQRAVAKYAAHKQQQLTGQSSAGCEENVHYKISIQKNIQKSQAPSAQP